MSDLSQRRVWRADVPWHEEAGRVVVRKAKAGRIGTWVFRLLRLSPHLVVRLDPLGSEVWRRLDGRRVHEVLKELEASFPDEDHLAQRLGRHLSTLASNGLVRFS